MMSDWLNSALSPVIYRDIVLSIKLNTQIHSNDYCSHLFDCSHGNSGMKRGLFNCVLVYCKSTGAVCIHNKAMD